MINEYKAFLEAFKAGKAIKGAVKAKNFQLLGNSVGFMLVALSVIARGFGFGIPMSEDDLVSAGQGVGSIYLLANAVITVVTSEKVGLR